MTCQRRLLVFFLLMSVQGIALGVERPSPPDAADILKGFTDDARQRFQLAPVADAALADPEIKVKLAFIYVALSHTVEWHIHQMRGASGNRVFLSPDGHNEAVRDEHGKLVTDCANQASYNYFPADREPLEHFLTDMLPWIEFGNCASDPTSKGERISAYLQDFRHGAIEVFNGRPASLPADFTLTGRGRAETAAFFLRVLRETPAREIAKLYTRSATADDFERFFTQFSVAFTHAFE